MPNHMPLPALPTHDNGRPHPPPPPPPVEAHRETFAPAQPLRFYPLDLGLALGLAATVFMLFAMLVTMAANHPESMTFFKEIFPGFGLDSVTGVFLGLLWSFIAAFVIGFFTGWLYNWRVRRYMAEHVEG